MSHTVLIVDDEVHIRKLICRMLEIAGFEVLEASSGRQALQMIAETPPDIVTCDITMPDIDGFAVLKELRENPLTKDIPVVVITAQGQQREAQRATEMGANDYITKPFSHVSLIETLQRQVEQADGK
ncbi:MAG: response regulator [Anaerolineae bacterium]